MTRLTAPRRMAALATLTALCFGTTVRAQIPFQETLYLASDGAAGDNFGSRVATGGNVTAVCQIDWANRQSEIGRVYVLEGCNQAQEFQLQGSGLQPSDMFAMSVATDGKVIVAGAPETDSLAQDGVGGPGMVYVFRRNATSWQEEAILTPASGGPDDGFGWSVAVDGDLIAVGAPGTNTVAGVVYLYRFDGVQWNEEAQVAAGAQPWLYSGYSVGAHGDTVVTGQHTTAPWWAPTAQVGHAIACRKVGSGWQEIPVASPNGTFFARFGLAVAAGEDRIVVGAPGGVTGNGLPGEAFLFDFNGSNSFDLSATFTASDAAVDDLFGYSVAIANDLVAVGAPWNDSRKGAVYVEQFDGAAWSEDQKLTASDASSGDGFGNSVAMFGGRIVSSAAGNDDLAQDAGSVYFFSAPMLLPYGSGLAGSGGIVPTLGGSGSPEPGSTVTVEARDFIGGAPTILFLGTDRAATPVLGGTLLVNYPGGLLFLRILQGSPGVPGAGWLDLSYSVPPVGVGCISAYVQFWALDPGAVSRVSMSNGLEIYFTD